MNFRNIVLFCMVLLTAIGYSTEYVYEVQYSTAITIDGNAKDWGTTQKQHLVSVPEGTQSEKYIMLSYNIVNPNTKTENTMLCGFFWMSDNVNNAAFDYFSIYNMAVDAEHPLLRFGRNARIYDVNNDALMNSNEYQYKKLESTGGWQGEFCVPFSYVGFKTSSETINNTVIRYENNYAPESVWPFGKENSWYLHSADKWLIPKTGCVADSECKDIEKCVDGSCKAVHPDICGYVANHQWNEYECCSNTDCPSGTNCVNNVCKNPDECTFDSSCADTEYCAVASYGNKCLPVQGTCGYAKDHKWNAYECCTSEACAPNAYCSGNVCNEIEVKSCGQIINHAWVDYDCCWDAGCEKGNSCVENKCVTANESITSSTCSGKVGLNVFYYDKLNNLMAAEITGLSNCKGNVAFIRKDSCTGGAACAFNIGNVNNCTFAIPNQPGIYKYVACVNIDGDTSYGPDETDTQIVEITSGACQSIGCTPEVWESCVCEGSSNKGYKSGICIDNCLERKTYKTECSCGIEVTPPEEIRPPEEQVPAKPKEITTPPAPEVPIEYWQVAAVIFILAIPVLLHFLNKGNK